LILITTEVLKVSCTFSFTGVAELERIPIIRDHTDRSPDIRTNASRITGEIIGDAIAFSKTAIAPGERIAKRRDGAHRIIDQRAYTCGITGHKIGEACTSCPAFVCEREDATGYSDNTMWIEFIGRTIALVHTGEEVIITRKSGVAGVRKLENSSVVSNHTDRIEFGRAGTDRVVLAPRRDQESNGEKN
jgi:hypothetical protein